MDREVEVHLHLDGETTRCGTLWSHRRHGGESGTFEYSPAFLRRRDAYELDPALPLASGPFQTALGRAVFGCFSDSAPDGWGRRLVRRYERRVAAAEGRAERSIGEIDFLLGVRDDLRQGALRFATSGPEGFLAREEGGVPALLQLGQLLNDAERLEEEDESLDQLRELLRGGSSLGGARPKAHVLDASGVLSIAKFPSSSNDDWDVIRWEAVALDLARAAGIRVPTFSLETVDGRPVLIVRRFDRSGGRRIGYASAMTMLEATDGERGSYLEIATSIEERSPAATADLHELWRRIAFTVLISNLDDHLRNHGFLRFTTAGWSLSPVFDVNPDPRPPRRLATAIDRDDLASLDELFSVAPGFRLKVADAVGILDEVFEATRRWKATARRYGLPQAEVELMAPAFEHDQVGRARSLVGP